LAFDGYTTRYSRIRLAWDRLRDPHPRKHDHKDDHGQFAVGLCVVWPRKIGATAVGQAPPPPWPDNPKDRLIWLHRNGFTPWTPTPTQQDEAWLATHHEQYEAMKEQNRRNQMAYAYGRSFAG
jgi:hypothetical protein